MAAIPKHALDRLRAHNLFAYPPFPSGHVWPDGVRVMLADEDNAEFDSEPDPNSIVVHGPGPSTVLYSYDGTRWYIDSIDGCGGFIPGDFSNCWPSLDQAIEDVLDFFDSSSIRLKAKLSRKQRAEGGDIDAFVSEEIIEQLRENGIVEVTRVSLGGDNSAIGFSCASPGSNDDHPVIFLYRWKNGGWCVDGRTENDIEEPRLQRGEFFHVWPTIDAAIDDLIDFSIGSKLRRLAWIKGKKYSAPSGSE